MTRASTPLRVIYGAGTTPVVVCWPEFSRDRYTYDGGWDIYAAGLRAASGLAARGQSRLRHGKVIFVTSTLRR